MISPLIVAAVLGAAAPDDLQALPPSRPAPTPSAAEPARPPLPPPAPDLRVRVYLKDLDHLAEVMRKDAQVGAMAESLVERRNAATTIAIVGVVTGVGLGIAGVNALESWDPQANPGSTAGPPSSATGLMIASAVSFAVSAVVALIVAPRPDEVLDVVNAWNRGHRDEQVALAWASSIQQVVPPDEPTEQER